MTVTLVAGMVCAAGLLRPCPPPTAVAPATIIVATSRGESLVPVTLERGHAALAAPRLVRLLPLTTEVTGDWAIVGFAGQPFRFLLGAPAFVHGERVIPLAGGAYLARDTLFLPLQWLAGYLPQVFSEGYRYDPLSARFEEALTAPVVTRITRAASPTAPRPAATPRGLPPSGVLRRSHTVVVDAGHGGVDPGNPGIHFPRGLREKDINLAIAKALRVELQRRGISAIMTRVRDTLIDLYDRGGYCRDDCDLFVSIHVNSIGRRRGAERVRGFETYFQAEARTAEAQRVAAMENDAVRYETNAATTGSGPLEFILKDLQTNEHLRESAVLAELIQGRGGDMHPGGDRGVSQAGFVVLNTVRRPAVLVETGFSTNRDDARFLASAAGQQKIAAAIADGIVEYLRGYESKVDFDTPP